MAEKKNRNYLSGKEIKAIAKANAKRIKELEKYKNRKAEEHEFLSEMKNPDNILEIDDLHTSSIRSRVLSRQLTVFPTTCPATLWWASWANPAAASPSPPCLSCV